MKRYLAGLLLISSIAFVGAIYGETVTIETLLGVKFDIKVDKDMTINELKKAIEKRVGIKADSQDLIFCGKLIRNGDRTIQDFGMDDTGYPITVKHSMAHYPECPAKCGCYDAYCHNIAISHIFIEFNGKREKLNYTNLNTDSTVADLKLAIQKHLHIPIQEQRLILRERLGIHLPCNGKVLKHLHDADKLTEYGFFKFAPDDAKYPYVELMRVRNSGSI